MTFETGSGPKEVTSLGNDVLLRGNRLYDLLVVFPYSLHVFVNLPVLRKCFIVGDAKLSRLDTTRRV